MRISICIPQYNRSDYLLRVLDSICAQEYQDIEVIVSDDCSTDDSASVIPAYMKEAEGRTGVRFRYVRHASNLGYDGNLRAAMGAGTGDYLFLLGNDDALSGPKAIVTLADVLRRLDHPDVVFANFHEFANPATVSRRAVRTCVIGRGPDVALHYFRSFSFFGSLAFKRQAFQEHNTDAYDHSIYVQIYLASRIVAAGGMLATIADSLVAKDVVIDGRAANSYRDVLRATNDRLKPKTGGLDQVGRCAAEAILPFLPSSRHNRALLAIYGQLLVYSYPYWLHDYRSLGVARAAVNLAWGCVPSRLVRVRPLAWSVQAGLFGIYAGATAAGLLVPTAVLGRVRDVAIPLVRYVRNRGAGRTGGEQRT